MAKHCKLSESHDILQNLSLIGKNSFFGGPEFFLTIEKKLFKVKIIHKIYKLSTCSVCILSELCLWKKTFNIINDTNAFYEEKESIGSKIAIFEMWEIYADHFLSLTHFIGWYYDIQ